jgi:hypothetical protein
MKYWATIEHLKDQPGVAIVTLADETGAWAGSGRVEVASRDRRAVYEEAYRIAAQSAAARGGRLDRFAIKEV